MDIAIESRGRSRFQARIAAGLHCFTCERCRGLDDILLFSGSRCLWMCDSWFLKTPPEPQGMGKELPLPARLRRLGPKPDAFCQLSTKFAKFVS